jgi:biotin-dependent carboxylase-like uncharacterized protein
VIEIVRVAGLVTVQDLGRRGYAHLGVGCSGAADRAALRMANRLVGNDAGAAALEVTLGGLSLVARTALTVALTGAPSLSRLGWGAAVTIAAGTEVTLDPPATGLRSYLAVRGGVAVAPVLGSRSTDTLGGVGPDPLRPGDLLPVGAAPAGAISGEPAAPPPAPGPVRVIPGPRADWFEPGAVAALTGVAWQVRPDSNRVGLRLSGPVLARARPGELPTEPTLPGAIQVPPDGQPIVLGPDAPVTGGYPVIAVVADVGLDALAQVRPGDLVRFTT